MKIITIFIMMKDYYYKVQNNSYFRSHTHRKKKSTKVIHNLPTHITGTVHSYKFKSASSYRMLSTYQEANGNI